MDELLPVSRCAFLNVPFPSLSRSPLCREYSYNLYFEINDISLGDISNYCHTSEVLV